MTLVPNLVSGPLLVRGVGLRNVLRALLSLDADENFVNQIQAPFHGAPLVADSLPCRCIRAEYKGTGVQLGI